MACPWGWSQEDNWYYELENSGGRRIVNTHAPDLCIDNESCCIHNPSDHPYRDWEQVWGHPSAPGGVMYRWSRKIKRYTLDPDDPQYRKGVIGVRVADNKAWEKYTSPKYSASPYGPSRHSGGASC
jgi:hypothetical protein